MFRRAWGSWARPGGSERPPGWMIPPATRLLWDAGTPLIDTGGPLTLETRMGYVLKLDALAAAPQALVEATRATRDHLVAFSPDLDVMQQPV